MTNTTVAPGIPDITGAKEFSPCQARFGVRTRVKQAKPYEVQAIINSASPNGWCNDKSGPYYREPNGLGTTPSQIKGGVEFRENVACPGAPIGSLIGVFVPDVASSTLLHLDLSNKNDLATKRALFARSFPVGSNWTGIAPFDGWLVLAMNDDLASFDDNEQFIDVKIT